MHYVAGLFFNHRCTLIALIRKNKPEWQAGKLNAIGGKIEITDTSPLAAMQREFQEEAGLTGIEWQYFCQLKFDGGFVHFFKALGDVHACRSMEEEQIEVFDIVNLPQDQLVPNLRWLIPLALYGHGVTMNADQSVVPVTEPNTEPVLCEYECERCGQRSDHYTAPQAASDLYERGASVVPCDHKMKMLGKA